MKKQTAVEWLRDISQHRELDKFDFEQAKAMEREQIVDAFGVGCQVESTRLIGYHDMANQYFNETYGGE